MRRDLTISDYMGYMGQGNSQLYNSVKVLLTVLLVII